MWINLDDKTVKLLRSRVKTPAKTRRVLADLREKVKQFAVNTVKGHKALVEEARNIHANRSDNNIEVDDDAAISPADDGTWVMGWLWVPNLKEDGE